MTTENASGEIKKIKVKGKTSEDSEEEEVIYSLNVIRHVGDMVLDGTQIYEGSTLTSNVYEFGSQSDVATASSYAQNTVVLKVEGNLTINEGVTLTAVKSTRTDMDGPKGMFVYCTRNFNKQWNDKYDSKRS